MSARIEKHQKHDPKTEQTKKEEKKERGWFPTRYSLDLTFSDSFVAFQGTCTLQFQVAVNSLQDIQLESLLSVSDAQLQTKGKVKCKVIQNEEKKTLTICFPNALSQGISLFESFF